MMEATLAVCSPSSTPGEGHEKGGVEGEAGFFRRNHLVPVPAARDLDESNAILLAGQRGRARAGACDPDGPANQLCRSY
jgi:hypothetical protein